MTTTNLINEFKLLTTDFAAEITGVISSDLLSLVMGKGLCGNVLITVQNNINSVAVASLLDLSCIIFSYDSKIDQAILDRAQEEEITLFRTSMSSVEVVLKLEELGIL